MRNFNLILTTVVIAAFTSCAGKYDVNRYYSVSERDSLLADLVTYIYVKPKYATWQSRFNPEYRTYYVSQLGKFRFERYYIDDRGIHYYYLIRPAHSAKGNIRGVGGRFKMNQSGEIIAFEEVFNTPVAALPELRSRGEELFNRLVKWGNVDDYLKHPDYVEWPDEMTYYDTLQHEWLIRQGI